MKTKKKKK
jgi:hypothetical protein